MQKPLPRPTRTTPTFSSVLASLGAAATAYGNRRTATESRLATTLIGLTFVGLVGLTNLGTTRGLNLEWFYLLGCGYVGWAAGSRPALVCALVAGVFRAVADAFSAQYLSGWVVGLNAAESLATFAAIGWLAAQLGRLTTHLERTIEYRTSRLRSEAEEHKSTSTRLRETLRLFRQVTDNITEVFWVTDPAKTRVDYVSPGFENIWGESRNSLYVSPAIWIEGIHPDDRDRITQSILTRQVTGDYDEEYRVRRPDGSIRWVHDRAFQVRDEQGAVYRLVGLTEDITERKRTEQLLRAQRDVGLALSSTSDLRFALERLLDVALQLEGIDCGGVYLLDPATGELHLQAHRGLSESFVRRVSHYRSDTTEARLVKSREILYVKEEQIPRNLEVLWGSEGLRALAVAPVSHKGVVLGMLNLGSYRENEIPQKTRLGVEMIASHTAGAIARIRAEESLRRSEANLRTIIRNAPVALFAGDRDGRIIFEDGHALEDVGMKPGENVGRLMTDVYDRYPLVLESVRRAVSGEEFSALHELGGTVFECHFTPTRNEQGGITGFLGVATNVTERFRLERQILEISDREQARIGQDIHDGLCQQLVSLAFDANSLERLLAAAGREEARLARRLAVSLDEAITESRRVSRGLYPVRLETEGLVPALRELTEHASERSGLECRCEADSQVAGCDGAKATHLYRIAQEAVNNARKHSEARSLVIRLTKTQGWLELTVEDDGKGFAPPSRGAGGMGLHTMEYRARSMGGTLQVHAGSPRGAVVRCRIPQKDN
jgi:PAS domain S-box-containing protein